MSNGESEGLSRRERAEKVWGAVKEEFAEAIVEVEGEVHDFQDSLNEMEPRAIAALEAGDHELIAAMRHEIPVMLGRSVIATRGASRARLTRIGSAILKGLFGIATRRISLVLLLAVLITGCAGLTKRHQVSSSWARGLVGEVCDATADCVTEGHLDAVPADCSGSEGTLTSTLRSEKSLHGAELAAGLAPICNAINTCRDSWDDLPPYKSEFWRVWCEKLQGLASDAINE